MNAPKAQRLLANLLDTTLAAILVVLAAGLWLAFFSLAPLELTPPRIR